MAAPQPHFLVLTFPAQGHINPALQFAKRLLRSSRGARVTFSTTLFAYKRMHKSTAPIDGLFYAAFSDGYDDGFERGRDSHEEFISQFNEKGLSYVSDFLGSSSEQGHPITCVVYTLLLPWAAQAARASNIPSRLLWIQPAAVLAIYYHYFHGYRDVIESCSEDPSSSIQLPGLPSLSFNDLPSFFDPSSTFPSALAIFEELFNQVNKECNPKVMVNSFDALEPDAMRSVDKVEMIGVGPLIPSAFLDEEETGDRAFGDDDYVEWLDSKQASSVVYVSFGSISVVGERQMGEILKGLLESGFFFLWVMRPAEKDADSDFWKEVSGATERKLGVVVEWCSQVEVLSHPSVGCFVSHSGWNSTSESLAAGVPMVGFPQWTDQPTNIKMVESVWKAGVRAKVNEDGVLEGGELRRCLDWVMGAEGEEIRKNAANWKKLARKAAGAEGGSSFNSIRAFVEEMTRIRK
ncbi:hypothetical protein ACLOJK_022572 [Asimina triloba]